jgi:prolyl-tRNA synthetase
MSGVYTLLPLGFRVCQKITAIVRAEMDGIGAQEFRLPALHPADLWQQSGRWETMGDEMFRLRDRRGADAALGMTHEEVFATIASELRSGATSSSRRSGIRSRRSSATSPVPSRVCCGSANSR